MSAHAIWTGRLSVGLVTVGVKAYKSCDEPDAETSLRQLHNACSTPINQKRHCEKCNVEIPYADIVKGYENPDGSFVVLTADELKAIKAPSTDTIAVTEFVPVADIDPIYVSATYYLTPDKGQTNGYATLAAAMTKKRVAAQGRLSIYGREHNVTVRPFGAGLVLQLMRTVTEIRDARELPNAIAPGAVTVDPAQVKLAEQLLDMYAGKFDATDYEDEYLKAFKALVDAKKQGAVPFVAPAAKVAPATPDLMSALKASLDAASRTKAPKVAKKPVEKTAAKKRKAS